MTKVYQSMAMYSHEINHILSLFLQEYSHNPQDLKLLLWQIVRKQQRQQQQQSKGALGSSHEKNKIELHITTARLED
jgi:predicted metal-dependent RNase